jgi:hypothetical protein
MFIYTERSEKMNGGTPVDLIACFESRLEDFAIASEVESVRRARHGFETVGVRLRRGSSTQEYALFCGHAVTVADLGRVSDAGLPLIVFTTFVAPRSAETFHRAGVQYLDAAGNAWIEFGDVLIHVRGQGPTKSVDQPARAPSGNLFSTGRAQVILALLAWPQLWKAPQRDLARAAGVSLGQAHNTLTMLTESGYGPDRARPGKAELLDLWSAAFPSGLAQKLRLATYRGDIDVVKTVHAGDRVFVSGEGAAHDLLRPATLTLYVEDPDPRLPVVNRWRSDGAPNIVVRRKFWQVSDVSEAALVGVHPAPWPLVYADLLASDDPRARGAAGEWRKRFARPAQNT